MTQGVEMLPVTATLWLERAEKHNPILPTAGSPMLAAVAEEMEEYADRKVAEFARAHTHPAATGSVREARIKALHWEEPHPSTSYPNWYARNFHTQFEARIDTSKALRWGKFPLSINGNMVDAKFDTVEQAKAYAQAEYETRMRQLLADVVTFEAAAPTPDAAASEAGEVERLREELAKEAKDWRHNAYTRVMLAQMHDRLLTTQGGAEG